MRARRAWWLVFAGCAAAVLAALGWVTREMLALEREQADARAAARHQEAVRLALWRMDSWLAPLLAQEAARPVSDFAWRPGAAAANPLGDYRSDHFRLHFQIHPGAPPTSPQTWVEDPMQCAANDVILRGVAEFLDFETLREAVVRAEPSVAAALDRAARDSVPEGSQQREFGYRLRNAAPARSQVQLFAEGLLRGTPASPGPLVPVWLVHDRESRLLFARRVQPARSPFDSVVRDEVLQGFVADWECLRTDLVAQVRDLLPQAALEPLRTPGADAAGMALATVPAVLLPGAPPAAEIPMTSPTRITLGVAWLAVLGALGAAAVTLRSSIEFGERRSRFASSVTHELRTPLTTFRLYSEMLARGMVEDPGRRQAYLETLEAESARLAALVENVLAYARVEDGRARRAPERLTVGQLLERAAPPLLRRAEEAGMRVELRAGDAAEELVLVNADSVAQVLFNLVDNACKYAAAAAERRIEVEAHRVREGVEVRVRDHGPGIPAERARAAFTPFERGGRPPGDAVPGIGLGLALSRALAREWGGELALVGCDGRGACLALRLPRGRSPTG